MRCSLEPVTPTVGRNLLSRHQTIDKVNYVIVVFQIIEQCYIFRCFKFVELYEKIKLYKDRSEEMSVAFKAMNNMHKLFSNFVKFG